MNNDRVPTSGALFTILLNQMAIMGVLLEMTKGDAGVPFHTVKELRTRRETTLELLKKVG